AHGITAAPQHECGHSREQLLLVDGKRHSCVLADRYKIVVSTVHFQRFAFGDGRARVDRMRDDQRLQHVLNGEARYDAIRALGVAGRYQTGLTVRFALCPRARSWLVALLPRAPLPRAATTRRPIATSKDQLRSL